MGQQSPAAYAEGVKAPRPAHTGVAIVLPLLDAQAEGIAVRDGEHPEDLHVTLGYFGKAIDQDPAMFWTLAAAVQQFAKAAKRTTATLSGVGRFVPAEGPDVIYGVLDCPALDGMRAALLALLTESAVTPDASHGFTPHVTLAYVPRGTERADIAPASTVVELSSVALWWAGERVCFPLAGDTVPVMARIPKQRIVFDVSVEPAVDEPAAAPLEAVLETPTEPVVAAEPSPAVTMAAFLGGRVVPFADGDECITMETADHNAEHVLGRLRAACSMDGSGDKAKMDWAKYARAFTFVDNAAAETFAAYHFPHHDVREGKMAVSRRGLQASARAFHAAMGDGSLRLNPEDVFAVKSHFERHFAQFGMDAPWQVRLDPVEMAADFNTASETPPGVVSTSWIQIAKVGAYKGHASGPFEFTPKVFDVMVANFQATTNRRVPIDYEHATERMDGAIPRLGAPAVGWIVALESRGEAGLWGRVEWVNQQAVEYVRGGQYRYFSPAVVFDSINRITSAGIGPELVSGGLTNRPFLDGMAPLVASAGGTVVVVSPAPVVVDDVTSDVVSCTSMEANVTTATPTTDAATPTPAEPTAALTLVAMRPTAGGSVVKLSWHEGVDSMDDLYEALRSVLNLKPEGGLTEMQAGIASLDAYLKSDGGARDGIHAAAIVETLRWVLDFPTLTPGDAVLRFIADCLVRGRMEAATFTIGADDVHVPSTIRHPPEKTTMSDAASPVTLSAPAAIVPVVDPRIAELEAANSALQAKLTALATADAETLVDTRITAGVIQASARKTAIASVLSNREAFVELFPEPVAKPVEAPAAPAALSARVDNDTARALSAQPLAGGANGAQPSAGRPMSHTERCGQRAAALRAANPQLDYRASLEQAEDEITGQRA